MIWAAHATTLSLLVGLVCSAIWKPRSPIHWWILGLLAISLLWNAGQWWLGRHGIHNHWMINLWPPLAAGIILPGLSAVVSPSHQDALWIALALFIGFWGFRILGSNPQHPSIDDLMQPVFALLVAAASISVLVAQAKDVQLPYWRRAATWAAAGLALAHLVDVVAWVALKGLLADRPAAMLLWTWRNALTCLCNLMLARSFRWA